MTKPRYLEGCAAGSQVRGLASSPADYAWNVNFNNGNANWNNHDNKNHVRAVRAGECQPAVSLRSLHAAWRSARHAKRPSPNQLRFDTHWLDGLQVLQRELESGAWRPRPATCFVTRRPKAREIHAPDFADRIVHHWLVPQLEALYEPIFIYDSHSNRAGHGTHAAVARLRRFVREVHSGEGGGWYLQLDIANFFNSIHRPTLYALLKKRMERAGVAMPVRRAVHALLRSPVSAGGVHYAATLSERALVPLHKRLENARPGCGIAIGNLSSQFFANVYLNELDQFVKHELKARRYVRYVDDFVLVHSSREQLEEWQQRIERFLRDRLKLALKPGPVLRPLSAGVDFLGYLVKPTHTLVRRRVVGHAREHLDGWARSHVHGKDLHATPSEFRALRSIWHSYRGHFSHASCRRLLNDFARRYPWLTAALSLKAFDHRLEGNVVRLKRRGQ